MATFAIFLPRAAAASKGRTGPRQLGCVLDLAASTSNEAKQRGAWSAEVSRRPGHRWTLPHGDQAHLAGECLRSEIRSESNHQLEG